MNDLKILERLNSFPKKIFSVSDLEKILTVKEKSLRTAIYRLVKKGVLQKLGSGWYSHYGKLIVPEEIASQIYYPSYLSLKTVLSKKGVINQIPRQIYSVTLNKSYRAKINNITLVYRQIKKELFFGFYQKGNQYLAYPEKALLDLLYFVSRGIETISFAEVDLSTISKKKLLTWSKSYPKSVKKLLVSIKSCSAQIARKN